MPPDSNENNPGSAPRRAPDPARYSQGPRGTRDFYPLEMAKRRWIEEKWRKVSIRHGFEEIDGPRFEHLDTYTVKSGEGIVSELFSFTRAGGETEFALRPEFTPTLARMVAAKANALPKPIKWFSVGPYFRAERPQRGRLREFLQWNVDMVGDPSPEADAEIIACCVEMLRECGLTEKDVRIGINSRNALEEFFSFLSVPADQHAVAYRILDGIDKKPVSDSVNDALNAGLNPSLVHAFTFGKHVKSGLIEMEDIDSKEFAKAHAQLLDITTVHLEQLANALTSAGCDAWCEQNWRIVRGLAYYTGTVFEVHEASGAERAIAGGGRYDNLVELFGGPSTPAVGFAMGDVVLALVLQDKGLMPTDDQIARDLGLTPEVFVFSVDESLDAHAATLLAQCRRAGMHARKSYKTTRNVGKLLKEASSQRARFAAFVEPSDDGASFRVQVKDLHGGAQQSFPTHDEAIASITSVR